MAATYSPPAGPDVKTSGPGNAKFLDLPTNTDDYVLVKREKPSTTRVLPVKGGCRLKEKQSKGLPSNVLKGIGSAIANPAVALTTTMRNMIPRDREFAFVTTNQLQWLTTIATGVMNGVSPITPSFTSDWSSLQALFDEFIVDKVVYKFVTGSYGKATSGSSTALSGDSMLVLAYDTDDNTGLTSTAAGCVYDQHVLPLVPNVQMSSTAPNGGHPHSITATPPKGTSLAFSGSGTGVSCVGHVWQSTVTGQFLPVGFWKGYWNTNETAATSAVAGIEHYHLRFRRRT